MTRLVHAVVLALVCAGCSFEASCGKKKVKTKEFEATIEERTRALGMNPTKVDCGEPVEAKVGNAFTCQVELDGEKTYPMNVSITGVDEKAERVDLDPKWEGGRGVVSAKIEEAVAIELGKRFGDGIQLDCGEPLRFVSEDDTIVCDIASGSYRGKATLVFKPGTTELADVKAGDDLLGRRILEGILEPSVREQTSPAVKVTCGDQAIIPRPADGILWCDIADDKQAAKIRVEIDEELNVKRWEVAEPPS